MKNNVPPSGLGVNKQAAVPNANVGNFAVNQATRDRIMAFRLEDVIYIHRLPVQDEPQEGLPVVVRECAGQIGMSLGGACLSVQCVQARFAEDHRPANAGAGDSPLAA